MAGKRYSTAERRYKVYEYEQLNPRPSYAEFARRLGVTAKTFGQWVLRYGTTAPHRSAGAAAETPPPPDDELARLRAEDAALRKEVATLKDVVRIFMDGPIK